MIPTLMELQELNQRENREPYVAGMGPTEPVDYWMYKPEPGKSWMCRDYTQAKADELRLMGVDPLTMTVILCWTEPVVAPSASAPEGREYHAVLAVDVDGTTMVLDNRVDDIYRLDTPPYDYRWDRRQVAGTTEFEPMGDGAA